jgi:cytochrome c-type biogenesis protein
MKKLFLGLFILALLSFSAADKVLAQTFSLKHLNGDAFSMTETEGKVTVFAVGASWLPLSEDQAVIINKLAKTFAKKDVVIYFVSTESALPKAKNYATDAQIQAFATKNKLTVPILRDTDNTLLKKYTLDQIPAFIILDKKGKVADKISGVDPDADVSLQITETINKIL